MSGLQCWLWEVIRFGFYTFRVSSSLWFGGWRGVILESGIAVLGFRFGVGKIPHCCC